VATSKARRLLLTDTWIPTAMAQTAQRTGSFLLLSNSVLKAQAIVNGSMIAVTLRLARMRARADVRKMMSPQSTRDANRRLLKLTGEWPRRDLLPVFQYLMAVQPPLVSAVLPIAAQFDQDFPWFHPFLNVTSMQYFSMVFGSFLEEPKLCWHQPPWHMYNE